MFFSLKIQRRWTQSKNLMIPIKITVCTRSPAPVGRCALNKPAVTFPSEFRNTSDTPNCKISDHRKPSIAATQHSITGFDRTKSEPTAGPTNPAQSRKRLNYPQEFQPGRWIQIKQNLFSPSSHPPNHLLYCV